VNPFVEECRREWKRLRVPDPVADEMAAELAADLAEAEAEGASAEDVLGSGAADARWFAASWAAERGVIPARPARRVLMLAAIAAVTVIAVVGAALAIFTSPRDSAPSSFPSRAVWVAAAPTPVREPVPEVTMWVPSGPVPGHDSGIDGQTVGSVLLAIGIAGMILSMLVLVRSSWARPGTGYL
jgi:hypothetical protein